MPMVRDSEERELLAKMGMNAFWSIKARRREELWGYQGKGYDYIVAVCCVLAICYCILSLIFKWN